MPSTYTTLSGTNTPSEMVTAWNNNFPLIAQDISSLEVLTSAVSGTSVGTTSSQTLTQKTMVSDDIGATGNLFTLSRLDLSSTQEFIRVQTRWVDPTNSSSSLTGLISDIIPGSDGYSTIDAGGKGIYNLVISGGNGIKATVSEQELHFNMDDNMVLNASGQSFLFGASAIKSGFDFDVSGSALYRGSLVISDDSTPDNPLDSATLDIGELGKAQINLRSGKNSTADHSIIKYYNNAAHKWTLGKNNSDAFYLKNADITNNIFEVNHTTGNIGFFGQPDTASAFKITGASKIVGNLDVSADITTGTFKGILHTDTVTTVSITDANVTLNKLAANSVSSAKIVDGNVTTVKIADDAVNASKLNNDIAGDGITITNGVLTPTVDNSSIEVSSGNLQVKSGGILAAHINSQAVTKAEIHANIAGAGLTGGNNSGLSVVTDNSSLEVSGNTVVIKDLGVQTGHLANDAVTNSKIANNAVDTEHITTNAVGTSEIKDGAVTNSKIANNAITGAKIGGSAVGGSELSGTLSGPHNFTGSISFANDLTVGGDTLSPNGQVPVGSVVAWVGGWHGVSGSLGTAVGVPTGSWKECNGGTVTDSESSMNGSTVPNLNGTGDTSRIFLRGTSSSVGSTGGNTTHAHSLSGSSKGDGNGSPRWGKTTSSDADHIPPYFQVKYIIRIK